jgi:hypothetical protein
MGNVVHLRDNAPLSNAERQRRYRERQRNAKRNEDRNGDRNEPDVTRNGNRNDETVTRNDETVTGGVTAYLGVTVTTKQMIEIVAKFEIGYVTQADVALAARIIMAFVHTVTPDGSVTLPSHVTGSVTDDAQEA